MQLTTTWREEDWCKLPVANWHCLAARSPEPDPAEAVVTGPLRHPDRLPLLPPEQAPRQEAEHHRIRRQDQ